MNITQKNSPNFSAGRGGKKIEYIICHWIVGRIAAADAVFAKANSTSAHYAVDDNKIHQYVSEDNTAWHAGNFDVNQRSIGIEHAGGPNIPITDATYETSAQLIADIWRRRGKLPLRKHSDIKATQCLPLDSTELLTRNGWMNLGEIKVGDEVAQWSENNDINFTKVKETVTPYTTEVVRKRWLEATADHRIGYRTQRGVFHIESWGKVIDSPSQVYIPHAGQYKDFSGLEIDEDLLRFIVWVQADGHYMYDIKKDGTKGYYGIEFHFLKQRKIDAVLDLAYRLNLNPKVGLRSDGTQVIRIYGRDAVELCEKWLANRNFSWKLLEMSSEQFEIFKQELLLADGCVANNSYSNKKESIDVVQALMAINNQSCHIYNGGIVPRLFFNSKVFSLTPNTPVAAKRETQVGCVTVDSGFILIRQYGKTMIAGNCPGTLDIARLERRANEILNPPPPPPPPAEDPRLAEYRNRITTLEAQLTSVKSELEAVKISRNDISAILEQKNNELGKLQVELADVKKELEKSNEIALGWIGKNDQLELELEKMTEKISKLQNDIKTARPVTGIARLVEALINWRKK